MWPQTSDSDPARAAAGRRGDRAAGPAAITAAVVVAAATALLGLAAGYLWAVLAPRPLLEMTGPGSAAVVNAETNAFIAADAVFCLVCLVAGAVTGLASYFLAVRRWGPLPMAGVLLGGLAAAFITRWVGEQDGLATFHHLLATLPAGARLTGALSLGASSALAFWPLAAGLAAGGMVALATPEPDRLTPGLTWPG